MKLYNKEFILPINKKDKLHGNAVMLLTPNIEASFNIMNGKNRFLNMERSLNANYKSYYVEKDISYLIANENTLIPLTTKEYIHEVQTITESVNESIRNFTLHGLINFNKLPEDDIKVVYIASKNCSNTSYNLVKRFINLESISRLNKDTLKAKIQFPIAVNIHDDMKDLKYSKCGDIHVLDFDYFDGDIDYYEVHCKEEIYGMIIKCINPNVDEYIYKYIRATLSGSYKYFEGEFSDICANIDRIIQEPNGYVKVIKMIKNNNMSSVVKLAWKDLKTKTKETFKESYSEDEFISEAEMDDLARIKRNMTYNTNKGSKHIIDKLKDNLQRAVDPGSDLPVYDKEDGKNRENVPHIVAGQKNIPEPEIPLPNIGGSSSSSSSSTTSDDSEDDSTNESVTLDYDTFSIEEESDYCLNMGNVITFFNEAERKISSQKMKDILYAERLKTSKDVIDLYDNVKKNCPYITNTYLTLARYKKLNLFVDLSYYNNVFFQNMTYKLEKGLDYYFNLLNKMINSKSVAEAGYDCSTVIIPIEAWDVDATTKIWIYREDINPISLFYRLMQTNLKKLKEAFSGKQFVFLGKNCYFKVNLDEFTEMDTPKFLMFIRKIRSGESVAADIEPTSKADSKDAITDTIIGNIEYNTNVKMYAVTGKPTSNGVKGKEKEAISTTPKKDSKEEPKTSPDTPKSVDTELEKDVKEKIIDKVDSVASTSNSADEAIDKLSKDEHFAELLAQLDNESNSAVVSAARTRRIDELDKGFKSKEVLGRSVNSILSDRYKYTSDPLNHTNLNIDSVNKEWENMSYMNMSDYDPYMDILAALEDLKNKSFPISIRNIDVKDMSTSEDYIYTYSVDCETFEGKRFNLKFDIPKFKNKQQMVLRGNKKTINIQMALIPILKTEEDTVQIISNYNKIFVRRVGDTNGKSYPTADRIIKTFSKNEFSGVKITTGDNSKICSRYELPIDYIDLATVYTRIETKKTVYYFNQEIIRKEFADKIKDANGIPYAYSKSSGEILYYNPNHGLTFSDQLLMNLVSDITEFGEAFDNTNEAIRYCYSCASILATKIPIIVLGAYSVGLTKMLDAAHVKYSFQEKRPSVSKREPSNYIKFKDGYLVYEVDYNSSLLMNGLKICDTANYSITEVNNKAMYLDFLDEFGGRIKADGIDNFYDCEVDVITKQILEMCNLPDNYIDLLAYSNYLLADNKYSIHGNMTVKRLRRNELIAGYFCKALATSYGTYAVQMKHGRSSIMTMKQSAVIDLIMADPTASDLSVINPLNEYESYNTASPKGLSGMNADRAYSLDKRSFDESMINVLGMSTGFAGTVGINRPTTIDANVTNMRGFVETSDSDDLNPVKSLSMTEAISVFSSTRDDPFRTAMTYIQTAKHTVRCDNYSPALITTGADKALPKLISDDFAFKAKDSGEVVELGEDYMIVKYKGGDCDYIDLSDTAEKNSSTGIFVSLKLSTDLKVGSKFKAGDIIAYDKTSFSSGVGMSDDLSYSFSVLAKCAIMDTDEGFEDSAIVDEELSEALTTTIIKEIRKVIPKDANISNVAKIGQYIREGEDLMVMQNSYSDEDAALLLRNLVDTEEDLKDLGNIHIKSKVTGYVHDIKIYRTADMKDLSPSLKKLCTQYESKIKDKKKVMDKYKINDNTILDPDYTIDPTGKFKDAADSVIIIFYVSYKDKFGVGDKLIYYNANKGVDKDIIPKGLEPYSLDRPDERLHTIVSIAAINGRMVTSIPNVGVINRLLIEESRKIKDMAGIPYNVNLLEK